MSTWYPLVYRTSTSQINYDCYLRLLWHFDSTPRYRKLYATSLHFAFPTSVQAICSCQYRTLSYDRLQSNTLGTKKSATGEKHQDVMRRMNRTTRTRTDLFHIFLGGPRLSSQRFNIHWSLNRHVNEIHLVFIDDARPLESNIGTTGMRYLHTRCRCR